MMRGKIYLILTLYILTWSNTVTSSTQNRDDSSDSGSPKNKNGLPNIIILLVDDLGYGDLGFSGHPTSFTPNIDELAANGKYFTQFYVTSPVCSPSRASILTGRYQVRSGIYPSVVEPENLHGLPTNETTIAKLLKKKGYSTLINGKWHLGVGWNGEHLPANHGFDDFLGMPYSQDMCPCEVCFSGNGPCNDHCMSDRVSCALFSNTTIIEQPTYLPTLSERLVEKAVNFIDKNAQEQTPFFLYMAFHHVHRPQFASRKYTGVSNRGPFGDSLAELDDSIGNIKAQLKRSGVYDNTIVWFTSDNGPSLMAQMRGGCAGALRCGKGTTWEGGVRVPTFVNWPGTVEPGLVSELASSLDILPTIATLTRSKTDHLKLDGMDLSPLLLGKKTKSPREFFAIYSQFPSQEHDPIAVVWGRYKAHYYTKGSSLSDNANYDLMCRSSHKLTKHDPPLLFDLNTDPGERWDMEKNQQTQAIIKAISKWRKEHRKNMTWMPPQNIISNVTAQPCCNSHFCQPFPECCDCNAL